MSIISGCLAGCFLYLFGQMLFKVFKIYQSAKLNEEQIIMFDGVCNLCDNFVIFILNNDTKKRYKFCSLSSVYAKKLLHVFNDNDVAVHLSTQDAPKIKSVILLDNDTLYFKSEAILRILVGLCGSDHIWLLCSMLLVVPHFIRDFVYDFIANRRYAWFGKGDNDVCIMPKPEYKQRFLN